MTNPVMSTTMYARVTGIVLAAVAVLGIVLSLMGDGGRYGLFCDGAMTCDGDAAEGSFLGFDWTHNILHVVLAAIALTVGFTTYARMGRTYAQVFGIVYLALGVLGFFVMDLMVLHLELGENLVHLLIGAWGVTVGFFGASTAATGSPEGA